MFLSKYYFFSQCHRTYPPVYPYHASPSWASLGDGVALATDAGISVSPPAPPGTTAAAFATIIISNDKPTAEAEEDAATAALRDAVHGFLPPSAPPSHSFFNLSSPFHSPSMTSADRSLLVADERRPRSSFCPCRGLR